MTSMGLAGRLAGFFINSKLTPLLVVASLLLGGFALLQTPREEEPQIIVPMVDVFVNAPGLSAKEVEQRVTYPMEKLLWEIPGVEYVYSTSSNGRSMAIVRFLVGEDEEDSILKTYNQLYANFDLIPVGVSKPLVKPRSIDDVPIVALTFTSEVYDGFALRRIAAEVEREVKQIADVSQTQLIGGLRRQLRIELSVDRLAAYGISPEQRALGTTENFDRFDIKKIDIGTRRRGQEHPIDGHPNGRLKSLFQVIQSNAADRSTQGRPGERLGNQFHIGRQFLEVDHAVNDAAFDLACRQRCDGDRDILNRLSAFSGGHDHLFKCHARILREGSLG